MYSCLQDLVHIVIVMLRIIGKRRLAFILIERMMILMSGCQKMPGTHSRSSK